MGFPLCVAVLLPSVPSADVLDHLRIINAKYPEDHWEHVHRPTKGNLESLIKQEVDAGRTLIVRWVHSITSTGAHNEQNPNWLKMTDAFRKNAKVSFAGINMADAVQATDDPERYDVGKPIAPQAGGWPTFRHFNTETGYGGAPYKAKTNKGMCKSLGVPGCEMTTRAMSHKLDFLQQYIEEAAGTQLCSLNELSGCSAEQADWYARLFSASAAETAELRASLLAELGALDKGVTHDGGPWSCEELDLAEPLSEARAACQSTKTISCEQLVPASISEKRQVFARCLATATSAGKSVWELCPSKCPQHAKAGIPKMKQKFTEKLREVDEAAARGGKEEL